MSFNSYSALEGAVELLGREVCLRKLGKEETVNIKAIFFILAKYLFGFFGQNGPKMVPK